MAKVALRRAVGEQGFQIKAGALAQIGAMRLKEGIGSGKARVMQPFDQDR